MVIFNLLRLIVGLGVFVIGYPIVKLGDLLIWINHLLLRDWLGEVNE